MESDHLGPSRPHKAVGNSCYIVCWTPLTSKGVGPHNNIYQFTDVNGHLHGSLPYTFRIDNSFTATVSWFSLVNPGIHQKHSLLQVSRNMFPICKNRTSGNKLLKHHKPGSGIARIFRWGGKILKKGTCINSKQVILTCRECSGAYSHHYQYWRGVWGFSPRKIFLKLL